MIHIVYPGKFKPVHDGHIYMIARMISDPEHDVHVIISAKDKDGLTAETSKWFLDSIFARFPNFECHIANGSTPIRDAYNFVATKACGDGDYAMLSSDKGSEQQSETFAKYFAKDGGKYHTDGVNVIPLSNEDISHLTYQGMSRDDVVPNTPISSTVVRRDIACGDWDLFKTSYARSLTAHLITIDILREYYNRLRREMNSTELQYANGYIATITESLNEGAAAGHIKHPYEFDDMTFGEIQEFVNAIFSGKITDITEKIDGMNLFASMSENGDVIFARNMSNLTGAPLTYGDIISNSKWNENVKNAFIFGAECITEVFKNIHSKNFFTYNDTLDGLSYQTWVNFEIVTPDTDVLIPYFDSFISIHGMVSSCFDRNSMKWSTFDDPNEDNKMPALKQAIEKIDKKLFNVQISPKVMINNSIKSLEVAADITNDIYELCDEYDVDYNNTILHYKKKRLFSVLSHTRPTSAYDAETIEIIVNRWIEKNKKDTTKLLKTKLGDKFKTFKEFEDSNATTILKAIMRPIDRIFIKIGNEALALADGLKNSGNEQAATAAIRKKITDIIDSAEKSDNESIKNDIEFILSRISTSPINASEGLVVKYGGRTFKLTGTYAALIQLANKARQLGE